MSDQPERTWRQVAAVLAAEAIDLVVPVLSGVVLLVIGLAFSYYAVYPLLFNQHPTVAIYSPSFLSAAIVGYAFGGGLHWVARRRLGPRLVTWWRRHSRVDRGGPA